MKLLLVAPCDGWEDIFRDILHEDHTTQAGFYGDEPFALEAVVREDYFHFNGFHTDADAIIARGTAVVQLRRKLRTPVIAIPQGPRNFENAARTLLTRCKPRKIAITGTNFSMLAQDGISEVDGIPVETYDIPYSIDHYQESLEQTLDMAVSAGCDAFVCGILSYKICRRRGYDSVFVTIDKNTARFALAEAKYSAYIYKSQKTRAETYRNIFNFSSDGIVSLDKNMHVSTINPAGSKMILNKHSESPDRNAAAEAELSKSSLIRMAKDGKRHTDEIVSYKDRLFSASVAPIVLNGEKGGSVIMLQDITHIQALENQIRNKIHTKGNVAKNHFGDIVGKSDIIRKTIETARDYAAADSNILICGKTGTGKELFAQSIHNQSARCKGPFVAVNCASLPENLLESEMFGYVDGAFTGASKGGKAGYFEVAHNGTIFLDEISETSQRMQVALLRVLQEKEIRRIGDNKVLPVDVRVISASNKRLDALVSEGKFREDLYYRLDVLRLNIPTLEERKEDIREIAMHFLQRFAEKNAKTVTVGEGAYLALADAKWNGNIRQLINVCERIIVTDKTGLITAAQVQSVINPEDLGEGREYSRRACARPDTMFYRGIALSPLKEAEKNRMGEALALTGGHMEKAAQLLSISRSTFYRKWKKYNSPH